jgi:ankyrin repeat protein
MGSSSSVQSSNPGSAEGSENVDFEAPEDIDDHETSTNSSDKVFVLETEVAVAVERVAPKLEKRIPYDKQKQYWGEDNIPYFRQVHYACQCPKGHALVPVVARHAVGFSHLKCVASPRSSKGDLKTNDPPLIRATQNTPQSSDFEWDPLRLVAPRHGEEQESRKQNDLLRSACADGDLDLVTKLLDQGVDVNCQDEKGVTPLHACAFASNLKLAQLLLRRGADQMQGDESEMAPIHYAAAEGALALVGLFVECGGTNVAGLVGIHGITPAHMAAHNGHCDVLSYIAEVCGPEYCDQLDSQDHSPLHLASSRGHSECIDVLLQIQMRCQAHLYNFDQMTPSNEDNDNINLAAAGLLLPFTEVFETDESIKSQELVGNCDSAKSLYNGNSTEIVEIGLATKLHKAVCCGMISEMRVLLFGGAKVDVYDANGFTPVHYACSKNRLDMVALMLNFGDREALATSLLKHGTTSPLMCAISTNDGPLVHYLVCKFPSWLEVRDSDGVVPVAAALDNSCSLALVRALVIGGADLKAIAKNAPPASRTHAHALKGVQNVNASVYEYASNFDTEAANFVRIVGLDPVVIRPQWCAELARHVVVWSGPNCPAAHQAAFSGRVSELQKLARNRSDFFNERDSAGFTALHAACAGGVLRVVDVLLKFNFVVDASDNDAGLSPLFFAVNGGFPLLVERLMPLVLDASTLYNLQGRSLLAVLPADESASVAISTIIMSIFPFIDDPVENPNVAAHVEQMRTNVQSAASYIVNTDPVSLSDLLTQMPLLIYCRMNSEGHTLLHMACERLEAVMCVELLCRIGAPVEAVMSNGLSALHIAALYKNLAAMKILLSCGASPDLADLNGLTPLHIAVIGTHSEGIILLVKDWHAESNVADFQIDRRYDASSEAAKHFTPKCAVASVLKVPDAGFGQDVAAVACCSEQNTLLCHACSVSTSRSASYGWFECSVENCSNCYALCASCMNILTAKDPPPASPLLKFLGKSKNGINSQTPTMPIVDSSKSGLSFDKKVSDHCANCEILASK